MLTKGKWLGSGADATVFEHASSSKFVILETEKKYKFETLDFLGLISEWYFDGLVYEIVVPKLKTFEEFPMQHCTNYRQYKQFQNLFKTRFGNHWRISQNRIAPMSDCLPLVQANHSNEFCKFVWNLWNTKFSGKANRSFTFLDLKSSNFLVRGSEIIFYDPIWKVSE